MLSERKRVPVVLALLLLFGLGLGGCNRSTGDKKITIGAKIFVENQIVAKIFQFALEDKGFKVDYIKDLNHDVLQRSAVSGEIDLYPEYTNTGVILILKLAPIFDPAEAYRTVKAQFKEQYNLVWLDPSKVNNTYCLVLSKRTSDRLGIRNFSQLQAKAAEIRAAQAWNWADTAILLPAMEARYGPFKFKDRRLYDGLLIYQVVKSDEADLLLGNTTDPQLEDRENYVILEDDKSLWPPYDLVPVIRQETLDKYPEIAEIINSVIATLDTEQMTSLNAEVVLRHEEIEDVARAYYQRVKR
jgi:osmoprotectant transport system substrate-binding protein